MAQAEVSADQVFRLPRRALKADLAAWMTASLVMLVIYYGFFTPFATTSIKVLFSCAGLGLFAGILSYLSTERGIVACLKNRPELSIPVNRLFPVSKKISLLIVIVVAMMAVSVLLMVLLDIYYLIGKEFSPPHVYWGVFTEIAFALAVMVGITLVIVRRYAATLKEIMDIQLAAMDEISRGNLEKQVPILSRDEFARMAEKTNTMMIGLQERDFCRSSFGQYVSPEISRKILDGNIASSGEILDVTVLFCDLRNYTGFSEKHSPAQVVALINQYFSAMEAVVRENGGVVLQYIGDEVEAVFGAPEPDPGHPDHAVAAAVAMRTALLELNARRRAAGEVEIRHGVGIHSGPVLAGNVGSEQRKTYSMFGDTVNLASRLQTLNKELGTDILISGETRKRLGRTDLPLQSMGSHAIRGKADSVDVYTVE